MSIRRGKDRNKRTYKMRYGGTRTKRRVRSASPSARRRSKSSSPRRRTRSASPSTIRHTQPTATPTPVLHMSNSLLDSFEPDAFDIMKQTEPTMLSYRKSVPLLPVTASRLPGPVPSGLTDYRRFSVHSPFDMVNRIIMSVEPSVESFRIKRDYSSGDSTWYIDIEMDIVGKAGESCELKVELYTEDSANQRFMVVPVVRDFTDGGYLLFNDFCERLNDAFLKNGIEPISSK